MKVAPGSQHRSEAAGFDEEKSAICLLEGGGGLEGVNHPLNYLYKREVPKRIC